MLECGGRLCEAHVLGRPAAARAAAGVVVVAFPSVLGLLCLEYGDWTDDRRSEVGPPPPAHIDSHASWLRAPSYPAPPSATKMSHQFPSELTSQRAWDVDGRRRSAGS